MKRPIESKIQLPTLNELDVAEDNVRKLLHFAKINELDGFGAFKIDYRSKNENSLISWEGNYGAIQITTTLKTKVSWIRFDYFGHMREHGTSNYDEKSEDLTNVITEIRIGCSLKG